MLVRDGRVSQAAGAPPADNPKTSTFRRGTRNYDAKEKARPWSAARSTTDYVDFVLSFLCLASSKGCVPGRCRNV